MKLIFGLFFAFLSGCLASPIDYRWELSPDGEGRIHAIEAGDPIFEEVEPLFNSTADTGFLLFTRDTRSAHQRVTWTAESIRGSNFNPNHPVRFLIHGWNSGPTSGVNTAPTAAYLDYAPTNVIVVDWSIGAGTINYISARNRVGSVAEVLARFCNFLVAEGFSQWPNINIMGHSLGAHIAGLAGKLTEGRINAIFGLDAADLLFSINSPNERLDVNDAVYTEGIHTNAGGLGFTQPITQVAFYPNGGQSQPGCGLDVSGSCAHSRAHALFAESVISNGFVARRCANHNEATTQGCSGEMNAAIMGDNTPNHGLTGVFHLRTNNNTPFAQG